MHQMAVVHRCLSPGCLSTCGHHLIPTRYDVWLFPQMGAHMIISTAISVEKNAQIDGETTRDFGVTARLGDIHLL